MTVADHTKEGLVYLNYSTEEGIELHCWFEYEAAERGAREFGTGLQLEPDYPATWTLNHVYLPNSNVDIAPLLRSDLIEEIEGYQAEEADQDAEDRAWDEGYEKFLDWKDSQ
jgi:hypothetical protein